MIRSTSLKRFIVYLFEICYVLPCILTDSSNSEVISLSLLTHILCILCSAVYRGNEEVHKMDLSNFDDSNMDDSISQDDNEGLDSAEDTDSAVSQNNMAYCE